MANNLEKTGATTLAEGDPKFKVDANLVFNKNKKSFILRTAFDQFGVWKTKYPSARVSSIDGQANKTFKESKFIDGEVWVFGIDATNAEHLVAAVKIAAEAYKTTAHNIFNDVFMKNLNSENEASIVNKHFPATQQEYWAPLVKANKNLYKNTSQAILEAAKKLNIQGKVTTWVFSNAANPKAPKQELHRAMRQGGLKDVMMLKKGVKMGAGSNDGAEENSNLINHIHFGSFTL